MMADGKEQENTESAHVDVASRPPTSFQTHVAYKRVRAGLGM